MQRVYCRWYDKELRDVAEHEQEHCSENGQDCTDCQYLEVKECGGEVI